MERIRELLGLTGWHFGRSNVTIAALGGAGALVDGLVDRHAVVPSFLEACATTLAIMAVLGIGQRLWKGAKVENANIAGTGLGLSDEESGVVEELKVAVAAVNDRVGELTHDVNTRLYDLESHVFKDAAGDSDAAD